MSDDAAQLFRVSVTLPQGRGWSVLVRAVDAESAAGAVRARGHNVVGVEAAEMPKRTTSGTRRLTCVNCGYVLARLPEGVAGEVLCPECGVVNTPLVPEDSTWGEFKKQRATRKSWMWPSRGTRVGLVVCVFVLIAMAATKPVLRWLGWLP